MTGKQNMVFWIGLIMILVNFWISGQSTILWKTLTNATAPAAPGSAKSPPAGKGKPAAPVKPSPKTPDPHGFVQ
jgi:hypothetical protein